MPGADVGGLLRSWVAALCLAASVLHVSAAADHRGMGGHVAFFLAIAIIQSILAAAVLWTRPGRWLSAGAVVNLAIAFIWVLSRTTGLPVDGSSAPEAIGLKDGISTVLEIGTAAGAGLWWLLPEGARRVGLPSGRRATALVGTGVWAVGAAGLFAGHTHSPGHTHAGQHAAAPEPGHDHATPGGSETTAAPLDDGHTHGSAPASVSAPASATHHTADEHHQPEARLATIRTSAHSGHDHGNSHPHREPQPAPSRAAGHRHDHDPVAAHPAEDGPGHEGDGHDHRHEDGGGDHRHSGEDHDHRHDEGGSGNEKGDEDGGPSPLEDVLKLIRPR